jgi:GTP-binding protein
MTDIRNIAIIAHVDHGKTTLTDALLRQTGAVNESAASMDSNTLEKERGITIYAKNASVMYKGTKINIVDTPGHADFGSEVERVLRSIDCVLLIVDAQEGPMPQTRFVLKKSLELGLKPIVVINKIDKPAADPARCEEQVLELFYELGANDEQANFPVMYAIGRQGIAKKSLTDESTNLEPLLDLILEHVPAQKESPAGTPLKMQTFNLAYDNFLGRMAIARVYEGVVKTNSAIFVKTPDGTLRKGKIVKLFSFQGLSRVEAESAQAGDIVMFAGVSDITIGETISDTESVEPLPMIAVDEPTITLNFLVNNSPLAGKDGKFVTSRQIRERLEKELEVNVGLKVDFDGNENFQVSGRGELHIAILIENMRREGFELQISQPRVITREENGKTVEPFEEVIIDTPSEYQGAIIERLGKRGFIMTNMVVDDATVRLTFEGPTRGLLGYRGQFVIDTKGEGILSSRVIGFRHYSGVIEKKVTGSMISMIDGVTSGFALWNLQDRGVVYVGPGVQVYEGMVIGNTSKGEEMSVNPIKGKQLTNVRASGSDEAITLVPPYEITIERGMEIMGADEYLEVTPKFTRLRKQYLTDNERVKAKKGL